MNSPKISVIICSIDAGKFARISECYKSLLAGVTHEIIGIHDARSLAEGYNRGITKALGNILIFSHDDILILDRDFAEKIICRMDQFDLLGFVGAQRMITGTWFGAGQPFLRGTVAHARPKDAHIYLDVYGVNEWPTAGEIQAVDGLCIIAHRELVATTGFDAETFDGFHLYDLDFSYSRHLAGYKLGVICDIPIIHESAGNFDATHAEYLRRFLNKYGEQLSTTARTENIEMSDSRPSGKGALFTEPTDLVKAWTPETLRRTTTAIYRQKGMPIPG